MPNKINIVIVYKHWPKYSELKYENERGRVFISNRKCIGYHNIYMSFYSAITVDEKDSLYVVEPQCVQSRDYDPAFYKQFKYIFTWASRAFDGSGIEHKVIEVNHPYFHGHADEDFKSYQELSSDWPEWNDRKNEIVIIANDKKSDHISELYSLRIAVADFFHTTDIPVSWYGQFNMEKPYYKGSIQSKRDILKNARFSLCSENCYSDIFSKNYFTEKLPDVLFAGTVPMYMGCYNVDDLNIGNCYIDLRNYVTKQDNNINIDFNGLYNKIKNYSESDYVEHLQKSKEAIDGNLYGALSSNKIYEKMIDVFYKETETT